MPSNRGNLTQAGLAQQAPLADFGVGIAGTREPITTRIQQRLDDNARRAAEESIQRLYRRRGGANELGVYGNPVGELVSSEDGSVSQNFQYGRIKTSCIGVPLEEEFYVCDIWLAAVKCYGTEDDGFIEEGEDEPYLIVTSAVPANAFFDGRTTTDVVKVWRSPTFTEIERKEIFAQNLPIFTNLLVAPFGISLRILLMEHQHGSEEKLEKAIREEGDKLARQGLQAASIIAGLPINEQVENQVLDTPILRSLGTLTVNLLTGVLKDDRVGEQTWILDASMLKDWVDNNRTSQSAVKYPDLPSHIETNFPNKNPHDPTWLFSGGGGSYKVFLRVIPKKVTVTGGSGPC